jgi:hypothetical protein
MCLSFDGFRLALDTADEFGIEALLESRVASSSGHPPPDQATVDAA